MRKGFTLMEIMVVIIVIAILSEAVMPMVTSVVNESRRSATIQKLKTLKDAIMKFKIDTGKPPHAWGVFNAANINLAGQHFMKSTEPLCPLIDDSSVDCPAFYDYQGFTDVNKYFRRWKGPYLDTDPSDFFVDAWGNEIVYLYHNKAIWLHSYGADGVSDAPDCFLTNNETDDLVMQIIKLKF